MPSNPEDSKSNLGLFNSYTNTMYDTWTKWTTVTTSGTSIGAMCGLCGKKYEMDRYHFCGTPDEVQEHMQIFKKKYPAQRGEEGESVKQVYEVMVVATVKDGDDVDLDKIVVWPKLVIASDQEEAVQKVLVGEAAVLAGIDFKVLARQFRGS